MIILINKMNYHHNMFCILNKQNSCENVIKTKKE